MTTVRAFKASDAAQVCELFKTVYGADYFYPEAYLPSVFRQRNSARLWHSVVALRAGRLVGHALLRKMPDDERCAELAMIVVHPSARHEGLAGRMGQHLCDYARQQRMAMLTIKLVSSHPWSQRLALSLGFLSTGLLLDYVDSPFVQGRESIVFAVLPLQVHPIPLLGTAGAYPGWFASLLERFGAVAPYASARGGASMQVSAHERRLDLIIEATQCPDIDEIMLLPKGRLTHLQLRMDMGLGALLPRLHHAGYVDTGLVLGAGRQWYWLLQRGFISRPLGLCCLAARGLHAAVEEQVWAQREIALAAI